MFLQDDDTGAMVKAIIQEHNININKEILPKWLQLGVGQTTYQWSTFV